MRQTVFLTIIILAAFVSSFAQEDPKRKPIVEPAKVLIGKGTRLPKPVFPSSGCNCKLSKQNKVVVEFVVDKKGNVESAKAGKGHPFLRAISESTIRFSKFTVSYFSNEPVTAIGVITYEFVLSKNRWRTRIVDHELKLANDK